MILSDVWGYFVAAGILPVRRALHGNAPSPASDVGRTLADDVFRACHRVLSPCDHFSRDQVVDTLFEAANAD